MKKLSQQELLLSFLVCFIILRDTCNSTHERLTCMFPVGGGGFTPVADVELYGLMMLLCLLNFFASLLENIHLNVFGIFHIHSIPNILIS